MAMGVVALVKCDTYDEAAVYSAVKTGVELLGGLSEFVSPRERILLKPNLLSKALPQKAVTTHPAVFAAVARLLRESGYENVSYGDSPGSPATSPDRASDACGIKAQAIKYKIKLADFESGVQTAFPEGRVCRGFQLCRGAAEAEAIINLPKMKTHALERITGAMKNMYGCVCGTNKAAGHVRFPNSYMFADMIADLHRLLRPRLHILDGISAMEGNGPTSGVPTPMNVLLFSSDAVALDSVYASLVHLSPEDVPTCVSGFKAGLGLMSEGEVVVRTPEGELTLSQAREKYGKADFDVFRGKMTGGTWGKFLPLLPFLQDRPRVDLKKCVACGVCREACPVPSKAVSSGNGKKARYDYKKCIRCYCCQEMCPAKAITIYRSPLNRLFSGWK